MHRRRARKPLPGLRTCEIPVSARGMHHEPGYGQLVGRCSPMSAVLLLRCKTQLLPTTQLMLRLQQVHAASSSPCRPSSAVQLCFWVWNSLWTQEQVNPGAGMPKTATNEFGKVYLSVTVCIGLAELTWFSLSSSNTSNAPQKLQPKNAKPQLHFPSPHITKGNTQNSKP